MAQVVTLADSVDAPARPPEGMLAAAFLPLTSALTLGFVRARADRFTLGPLELLRFGPPEAIAGGVRWPIRGGLLAAGPGGHVGFDWREGRLEGWLRGYRPAIPSPLYELTQLPVHRLVTRLFLLHVRGRDPLPGPAATHRARRVAAVIDLGICVALGRRRLRRTVAVAAGYQLLCRALGGRTLGERVLGLVVVSVDGSPPTAGQALARLLGDDFAATAVVEVAQPASSSARRFQNS